MLNICKGPVKKAMQGPDIFTPTLTVSTMKARGLTNLLDTNGNIAGALVTRVQGHMISSAQLKLWEACEVGDEAEVDRCLKAGAKVTEKNRFGWNALHRACMSGNPACVALVLPEEENSRGALLSKADTEGNSPLHMAVGCGHAKVVAFLLKQGAKPNAPKRTEEEFKEAGATPMHTGCKALAAATEVERQERIIGAILALLNGGGLLEATDQTNRMAASFLPQALMVQLLARVRAAAAAAAATPPPPEERAPDGANEQRTGSVIIAEG